MQSKALQSEAMQITAEQSNAKQSNAMHSKAKQSKAKQCNAKLALPLELPFAIRNKSYWSRAGIIVLGKFHKSRKGRWVGGSRPDFHAPKL